MVNLLRKNNWFCSFYPKPKSKNRTYKSGFKTKKLAQTYEDQHKSGGINSQNSIMDQNFYNLHFAEVAEKYLYQHLETTKTGKSNSSCVKKCIQRWGDYTLAGITTEDVREWITELLNSEKYEVSTISNYLTYFKRVYSYANEIELIDRNPIAKIKFTKEFQRKNVRKTVMDIVQFKEFVKCFDKSPWYMRDIITILFHTGWRINEVLSLKWGEIDLRVGMLLKKAADTKEAKDRVGVLEKEPLELLKEIKERTIKKGESQLVIDSSYVFNLTLDKHLSYDTYYQNYRKAVNGTKWHKFNIHDQRGSLVTRWRQEGKDRELTKLQTGHSTNDMYDKYNVTRAEELKKLGAYYKLHAELLESVVDELKGIVDGAGISPSTVFAVLREKL